MRLTEEQEIGRAKTRYWTVASYAPLCCAHRGSQQTWQETNLLGKQKVKFYNVLKHGKPAVFIASTKCKYHKRENGHGNT